MEGNCVERECVYGWVTFMKQKEKIVEEIQKINNRIDTLYQLNINSEHIQYAHILPNMSKPRIIEHTSMD